MTKIAKETHKKHGDELNWWSQLLRKFSSAVCVSVVQMCANPRGEGSSERATGEDDEEEDEEEKKKAQLRGWPNATLSTG